MKTFKLIFEKQLYNYIALAVIIIIVIFLTRWPGTYEGSLWGLDTSFWLWLSIGIVIFHQLYVWVVWRLELHLGSITRWLGRKAFTIWSVLFMILFILRFLVIFLLGYVNRGTWNIIPILGWVFTVIILIPAIYTLYSIERYFSFKRALGIDHFDPAYRKLNLVRQGIFKFIPNAMYVFGIMVAWIPALVFGSKAALISAFFNHSYIWVHYYTVELPDMKRIYKT